jgi:predicted ester cyclase
MTAERNKDAILRHWAAVNSGNAKSAAAFWAAKPINHRKQRKHLDVERLHESLAQVYEHVTVHEMVAEGDWVACRITAEGRHKVQPPIPFDSGIYLLAKPEGRTFVFQHIHLFRLVDGKIKEHWANRDDLGAAKQLGLELVPAGISRAD